MFKKQEYIFSQNDLTEEEKNALGIVVGPIGERVSGKLIWFFLVIVAILCGFLSVGLQIIAERATYGSIFRCMA
jgi:hypothetical protein